MLFKITCLTLCLFNSLKFLNFGTTASLLEKGLSVVSASETREIRLMKGEIVLKVKGYKIGLIFCS